MIRITSFAIPLLVGYVAVRAAVAFVPHPDGGVGFWVWAAGLIAVSTLAATTTERGTRRLAPLEALFKMSLVFPDEAPSRFRAALRQGSARSLARRMSEDHADSSLDQIAAERLLALLVQLRSHDRVTRGHAERVRAYSVMLGEEIGLTSEELEKLNWGALIHDIGKLKVDAAILNKAGRPTEREWRELRRHPGASADLVEPLRPWLGEWADAATQHHERYDGKGYPVGLTGTDISRAGRIVAIADAYDVMTAERSYRRALPPEQARAELLRNAGTQFDPALVRSFLQISLGRMRWVVGPMGWLGNFPGIIRVPLTTVATSGPSVVAIATVAVASVTGINASAPGIELPRIVQAERSVDDSAVLNAVDGPVLPAGESPVDADSELARTGAAEPNEEEVKAGTGDFGISTTTTPHDPPETSSSLAESTRQAPPTTVKRTPSLPATATTTTRPADDYEPGTGGNRGNARDEQNGKT